MDLTTAEELEDGKKRGDHFVHGFTRHQSERHPAS